jgi:UDP:flavonoid glycosyltransferase YjiC (YdhE family)
MSFSVGGRARFRILMAGDGNFLSHTSRLLEVARVLRGRYGHEVVFACRGPYRWLIESEGFPVYDVYTAPGEMTLELVSKMGLVPPQRIYQRIERDLHADLECLERVWNASSLTWS